MRSGDMKQRALRAAVLTLVLIAAVLWPQGAVAQIRVSASPGGSFQSPINRKGVEAYARILRLDEDQRQAILALFEGYRSGIREVQQETKKLAKEMQEEFADSMDVSALKDAAKKFEPLTNRTQELEKQFFDDLHSLLTEEQQARVPSLERYRRRETNMRFSMVAGARVDLLEIADRLKVAEADPGVAQALESYEMEMDRALTVREGAMAEMEKQNQEMAEKLMENMDFSAVNSMMKKMIEMDRPLRELNKTYARRIGEALPEGKAAEFEREFKLRAFPLVYREPHIVTELRAALKLTDLSESQRTEIEQLQRGYEREAAGINRRWALAIEERDDKGIIPAMAMVTGGGRDNPTAEPRKARRDLDKQTASKLKSLLNDAQVAKLPEAPKRSQQEEMMEMMGMDIDPELMSGEDGWGAFGSGEDD